MPLAEARRRAWQSHPQKEVTMSDTTIRGPVPPALRPPVESARPRLFIAAPSPAGAHRTDPAVLLDPALEALEDAVAGAPGKGGVSAGPALREALERLRDGLSVLFLLMGYSEREAGQLADAVIGRIEEDVRDGKGPGADIMTRIDEVLAEPPPAAGGTTVTAWESVSVVVAIEELDVTLTTDEGAVSVSYRSVSVSVEHTVGMAVGQWGGDVPAADSGLFFGPGAEWLRDMADGGIDRPFDGLLLVDEAGPERVRLDAALPVARSRDGVWASLGGRPQSTVDAVV